MATLMQAVERVRNDGQLPTTGEVSARDLHNRFTPSDRGSLRAVQDRMFERAARLPWAVILCRFKGEPAKPAREGPIEQLFRGAFRPGTGGLVEYWRDVSLGKIDIRGSQVFGWLEVDVPRNMANTGSGANRSTLVDAAIRAARANGIDPVTGFHSQLSVYIENWSIDNVPPGLDWSDPTWGKYWIDGSADGRGKVSLTPPHDGNVVAHEMGHGFGMSHDLGANLIDHYQDPCCIMSQQNAFIKGPWNVPFGPALCVTHLALKGWMYPRRLYVDGGDWMNQGDGISLPLAAVVDPAARANLGIKLAYSRPGASWDYYLEYIRPAEWDQGLGQPFVFVRRVAPLGGGSTSAYLGSIPVPAAMGATAEFREPAGNVRFSVRRFSADGRIVDVRAKKL
jgi:hypothetical protein